MSARERRRLVSHLRLLAGLPSLLWSLPAQAEPFDNAGAGAFLGYAFGENGGFEWGVEGFATRHLEEHADCGDHSPRHGFGPLLRASMVRLSRLELTLAGHAGGELPNMRSYFAIDGELGASLFLQKGQAPRVAPHTGVVLESVIFHLYSRQEWLTPGLSVGGGARYLPTFGTPGFCEVGRPYRDGEGRPRRARLQHTAAFESRCPAARRWSQRAAEECASVPAFLQLANELLQLAAPPSLIVRALRAARQEREHTQAAAGLAQFFGGARLALRAPVFRARPRLPRPLALRRLAREAWLDGCLNEGLAAALAGIEAAESGEAAEVTVSQRLARDEAEHAALALDVLRWTLSQAPELAALLRDLQQARAPGLGATLLTAPQERELAELATAQARQQLRALLA